MTEIHDLTVIGTGAAAQIAALRCRAAGWRVVVVDHQPFGGTCALRGCNPKKVLVGAVEALDRARRLYGNGLDVPYVGIEWLDLMDFKHSLTKDVPPRTEETFTRAGVRFLHGIARFVDPRTVSVEDERLESRYTLIATGAAPVPLDIAGAGHLATSDQFLELDALPGRIVFVGGGYIAAELSHVAAHAGAAVTILHRGARLLKAFDPDLVGLLMKRFDALGIDVRVNTAVTGIESHAWGHLVRATAGILPETYEADLVVHAAGRAPDLDALELPAAGVERERNRLKLNDYLQSVSNRAVYAAGDSAARGPLLTPVASYDGRIVASNLLEGNHVTPDYSLVPSVVFTIPPLAMVGLTEAAARERGLSCRVSFAHTGDWFSARHVNEDAAGYKLVIENDTERILGAHLLGPQADEVINVFAVAMRAGLRAPELKEVLFAYPTRASDIRYML